jgi:hypothetical protein
MALSYLSSLGPTRILVTIRDKSRKSVTKTFVVPATIWNPASDAWSDLVAIRDGLITKLSAVMNGIVFRVKVVVSEQEDAVVQSSADCLVTDIASIVTNMSTLGKTGNLQIPTPKPAIFQGLDGKELNLIDKTDADLLAYIALFQLTGATFSMSDGEYVDDTTPIDSGKRISKGSTSV